jgi:hypothetical protein
MLNLIRNAFYVFKKHLVNFKKDIISQVEIHKYSWYIKYNKKKLELYNSWPVVDVRNKAKVMYDKRLAEKLRYELEDEMKKETKNA